MSKLVIKSEEKRLVEVLIYEPMSVDTDTEAMTATDIEQLAHTFLREGRVHKVDHEHNLEEIGCCMVESRIVRHPEPGYSLGSWVAMFYIDNEAVWKGIKSGEINGVSWYGKAYKVPVLATVTEIRKAEGTTEQSLSNTVPPHTHPLTIEFDGPTVCPTITGEAEGHTHPVERMTAVEPVMGHGHRLLFEDEDGPADN